MGAYDAAEKIAVRNDSFDGAFNGNHDASDGILPHRPSHVDDRLFRRNGNNVSHHEIFKGHRSSSLFRLRELLLHSGSVDLFP
jgi:hypothetical protein